MLRKVAILSLMIAGCVAGVIDYHGDGGGGDSGETDHHSEVEHKHATSHQSFKIHHFHAVPVYVKKEDQQFLKHPVELGGVKHNLKLVHPETQHNHGHGLTLENHSEIDHKTIDHGHHSFDLEGHDEGHHDFGGHGLSQHQYQDVNVHHGHEH